MAKATRDSRSAPAKSTADEWAALTWDDLQHWAGSSSVERGRSYQRGGPQSGRRW